MTSPSDHDRLVRKLRYLGRTLDEMDEWAGTSAEYGARNSGADVPSLLQSILAKRTLCLEDLDSYLPPGEPARGRALPPGKEA